MWTLFLQRIIMPEFTDTKHDCNKPAHSCLKDGDNYPKYALTLSAALQSERKKESIFNVREAKNSLWDRLL